MGWWRKKKEDGGQREREIYREASGPALFDPLEETWEDGRTEGGEGGLIIKKYTHTHEKKTFINHLV